jgi:predicted RNA binding protein YcfA (HicA-like mRNA interferase family)
MFKQINFAGNSPGLERAGFSNRGGKGSHRNFTHPSLQQPVTISERDGDDAKAYQERAVRKAIEESRSSRPPRT